MGAPFHLHPFDIEPLDPDLDLGVYEQVDADWLRDIPIPSKADLAFGGFLVAVCVFWLAAVVVTLLHQAGKL